MRIGIGRALAAIALLVTPLAARAMQCQVTGMKVLVTSQGLDGTVEVPNLVFPVTIGTGGTFALDVSGFPKTSFTIVGVTSDLALSATVLAGSIDAGGNIQVPSVPMDFAVHLVDPPIALGASTDLTTGISSVRIGKDYVTEGTPLDFTTGALSLQGQTVIPNPPVLGSAVSTGLEIDCILSPIPDRSTLPAAPKLARAKGSGKIVQDAGDTLKLSAKFTQGARAIDPATDDVFIRIRNAKNEDALLVHVPAGALVAKGKRLSLVDTDGTKLTLVEGRKTVGGTNAAVRGKVALKRSKKGFSIALEQEGVDLAALGSSTGTVSVLVGGVTASDDVKLVQRSTRVTLR